LSQAQIQPLQEGLVAINQNHELIGAGILLHGDAVRIEAGFNGEDKDEDDAIREAETVRFGGESAQAPDPAADLRPAIEGHLRQLATRELPPRVLELAVRHGLTVAIDSTGAHRGPLQKMP
jgi:hypothetical protein